MNVVAEEASYRSITIQTKVSPRRGPGYGRNSLTAAGDANKLSSLSSDYSGYASNPLNIDYSSAAVGLGGHCNDYNITTEDASAARSVRGARPLDLKEGSGCSVLARQRAGF